MSSGILSRKEKVVAELPLGSLLLAAAKSVLDGGSSVAQTILSLLEDTLTLLGGVVRTTTGSIAKLLAGRLLALCRVLACVGTRPGVELLTRLDGAGNAVTSTGDILADLVGGGLLGVRSDWRRVSVSSSDDEAGGSYSSPTPARRDPCGGCQTF